MLAILGCLVRGAIVILIANLLVACAHDFYQQRTEKIHEHSDAFQKNLKSDNVEAAIYENEEIEAIASEIADAIRKRNQPLATNQVDYEWKLLKQSIQVAIDNWLALGRHFTIKKRYAQARATFQRLIDTYPGDAEREYRERASRAMRDLEILSPPSIASPSL